MHWTTRLMVFPRNVGFRRCYLVSTRHDRPKPNRNSAAATKKPKKNKSRESANPIPVLLLSFESQTVVFQLFDFHLRKFKKFVIKKVLLPQSDVPTLNLTMSSCWRWRKHTLIMAMHLSWVMTMIRSAKQSMNICGA